MTDAQDRAAAVIARHILGRAATAGAREAARALHDAGLLARDTCRRCGQPTTGHCGCAEDAAP